MPLATQIKICEGCKLTFLAKVAEIKRGNAKFCSKSCSSKHQKRSIIIHDPNIYCATCGKYFYRNPGNLTSKSGLYFCSRICKDSAQKIGGIKEIQPSHYGTGTGIGSYRDIAFRVHPKICMRCGWDKHPAAIVVHHIDRNRNNNNLSNLEVLCWNCYAIEHHGENQNS